MLVLYSDEYIMRHLPRLQHPGYFGTPSADTLWRDHPPLDSDDSDDSDTGETLNFVPGEFCLETRNWSSRHLCLDEVTSQEIHSDENVQHAVDNKLMSLPVAVERSLKAERRDRRRDDRRRRPEILRVDAETYEILAAQVLVDGPANVLLMVPQMDMLVGFMLVRLRVARARDRGEISRAEFERSEWGKWCRAPTSHDNLRQWQRELYGYYGCDSPQPLKLRVPLELFGQQFWVLFALHVAHNRGNSFVSLNDWSEIDICGEHYPDCLYETPEQVAFRIREKKEERRRVRDTERKMSSRHYYNGNNGHSDDEYEQHDYDNRPYYVRDAEMGCDCWTGDGMVLMANGSRQRTDTLQTGDIV